MPAAINTVLITDTFNTWRTTLNTSSTRWNGLGDKDDIDIDGGNIDGTIIGSASPSTAVFTNTTITSTLDILGASLLLDNDSISGDAILGGTLTVNIAEVLLAPTLDNHAANKQYVDESTIEATNNSIVYAIVFGG